MDEPAILVVTERVVRTLSSGYDLRVHPLVERLAQRYRVVNVVVDMYDAPDDATPLVEPAWVVHYPVRRTVRSLLRASERTFLSATSPADFEAVSARIARTYADEGCSAIVVFNGRICPLVPAELRAHTVVDIIDSTSLVLRRLAERASPVGRLPLKLNEVRWTRFERWITRSFGAALAITAVDAAAAAAPGRHVEVLPNGVGVTPAPASTDAQRTERSVAFWGNLDFEPNSDAVAGFVHEVVRPGLVPGVTLRVIGKGASPALLALAGEQVRFEGFQADLGACLAYVPVMANYMRLGAGLKNKVLEAFAFRIAVVSTAHGVQGFDGIVAGEHYLPAETPQEFADAVRRLLDDPALRHRLADAAAAYLDRFGWDRIGAQLCGIVETVREGPGYGVPS